MPADDLSGGNRVVGTYDKRLRDRGHNFLVVSNAPDRPPLRERVRAWRSGRLAELRARSRPQRGHIALGGVPHKTLERPRPFAAVDLPDADVVATWWETAVWMQRLPASQGRRVYLIQGYEVWGDCGAACHPLVATNRTELRAAALAGSLLIAPRNELLLPGAQTQVLEEHRDPVLGHGPSLLVAPSLSRADTARI